MLSHLMTAGRVIKGLGSDGIEKIWCYIMFFLSFFYDRYYVNGHHSSVPTQNL